MSDVIRIVYPTMYSMHDVIRIVYPTMNSMSDVIRIVYPTMNSMSDVIRIVYPTMNSMSDVIREFVQRCQHALHNTVKGDCATEVTEVTEVGGARNRPSIRHYLQTYRHNQNAPRKSDHLRRISIRIPATGAVQHHFVP